MQEYNSIEYHIPTWLSHSNMKTALMFLIFNIAALLPTQIIKHFAQHPFQGIIANWTRNGTVLIVGNVKCCPMQMTTIFGSITIMASQFLDIFFCAKDARH